MAAVFFLLTRQSRPVLEQYILQFTCVFCNFRSTKGKRTMAGEVLCRRLGREGITDGRKPGKSSSRKWEPDCGRGFRKTNFAKVTQVYTHKWEKVYKCYAERRWQIHIVKWRHATWVAFPDGCACLQLVLGIFFECTFWSHAWLHVSAHTHMEPQQLCV